ncbi:MAG: hypothetical protein ACI957_005408, partial [Verrucomicrobiales bacterium]
MTLLIKAICLGRQARPYLFLANGVENFPFFWKLS